MSATNLQRFGNYLERWEAEAVARSKRASGYSGVGVKKISAMSYTVTFKKAPRG